MDNVEISMVGKLDFLTKRQPKPAGFSPKILKKEQMMKSGWKRERPKVSMSLAPNAVASSRTCQPLS